MIASVIEYNIENYFFGDYFTNYKLMYIGKDALARTPFSVIVVLVSMLCW